MDTSICWFRKDLRTSDNPALSHAASNGRVLPLYILDPHDDMGQASRVWLHHSLKALDDALEGHLSIYKGDPLKVLQQLVDTHNITGIYWNRCYEPRAIKRDCAIKKALHDQGIEVASFNGSLLWEPWSVKKEDDSPYKVFTPFYKKGCLKGDEPRKPIHTPKLHLLSGEKSDLKLLPKVRWDEPMAMGWEISEEGAQKRLQTFLSDEIDEYKEGRNFPALSAVSRLSPYLHMGQISPHQVWQATRKRGSDVNVDHFCSELGWREFSYNLLFFNPELQTKNLQKKFDAFPWRDDPIGLRAWQKGQTGIPFVDAGMRELWQTGYMHNRVRMVVASFLIKHLMIDWRHGERWFWDCLFDADLANNSASWQWVAGSGADAAPYFRVFNPATQGEKFDPEGIYIRKYVPELKTLPNKHLFAPWQAPESVLRGTGVELGVNYPYPLVDLADGRKRALDAFASLK